MAVHNLPKPSFGPGELPRPCTVDTRRPSVARIDELRFASDDVRSMMVGFPTATLHDWARAHFRYANDACIEWDYVVRKFQAATGGEVTGIVSRADYDRLSQGLEQGRQLRRETTIAAADSRRSLLDFLPSGSTDSRQSCSARSLPLQQQIQARTTQRIMALPPQMRRSAVTEKVAREVTAEVIPVAPQWAEYWASRPVLRDWARRNGCDADLHFMVEHWQLAIGATVDARDPQAIARTEELLTKAQTEYAKRSEERRVGKECR